MNFYVIKLKHIIIALLIFAVIPIIWFTTSRAVSVFNVNGREIPIGRTKKKEFMKQFTEFMGAYL